MAWYTNPWESDLLEDRNVASSTADVLRSREEKRYPSGLLGMLYERYKPQYEQWVEQTGPTSTPFERAINVAAKSVPEAILGPKTAEEQAMSFGMAPGALGTTKIVKPVTPLAEEMTGTVGRALRGMGREPMQYMRRLIERGVAQPIKHKAATTEFMPAGRFIAETGEGGLWDRYIFQNPESSVVKRLQSNPKEILQHELSHGYYYDLPADVRSFVDRELGQFVGEAAEGPGTLARQYSGNLTPRELFAMTGEGRTAMPVLEEPYQQAGIEFQRMLRGLMRSKMRQGSQAQMGGGTTVKEALAAPESPIKPRSLPSFNIDVKGLPQYSIDRATEMLSYITHKTTPTEKEAIIDGVRRYLDRVRGIQQQAPAKMPPDLRRMQGKQSNVDLERLRKKLEKK